MELNLRFPSLSQVVVSLDSYDPKTIDFVAPLGEKDLEDIRWYLETYAASYTTDADDQRAEKIAKNLPKWGSALFEAVFRDSPTQRVLNDFLRADEDNKLLTISTSDPAILALPWELLRDSAGTYLVHEPDISIRRRFAGAGGGRRPFKVKRKDRLRMLFAISRPQEAGFIDPRAEAIAVMDAITKSAAGRIEVEFLRPATLDNLVERLEDKNKPQIDIVHFDGHGVYDRDGNLGERAKHSDPGFKQGEGSESLSNMGYLLFEDAEGKEALISASTLGDMLNRKKVGLIVLSACQSAKLGEDAMGSVAARLTHAGIPSVLAMTHSVLVTTTKQLFAEFYERLGKGDTLGVALDKARRDLYSKPERGERQRGESRIKLKLQDWFLPALYQIGQDTALLELAETSTSQTAETAKHNLPDLEEAGFFGRSWELWLIEKAFLNKTRRLTISGFGGQGKTSLAIEAGLWLQRTRMFEQVCFVPYEAFQGVDAVGVAVSTLGTVLEQSFPDADAVTAYLKEQNSKLLIVLDNLEDLAPELLAELLSVAQEWSEIGNCRLLLTTRANDLAHPGYPREGSLIHLALPLAGLGSEQNPEDALAYYQTLMKFPPAPKVDPPSRQALISLFKLVDFHPLSIKLLARQLKDRRPADIGETLEQLLADSADIPEKDRSLVASLNLSLQRLDPEARKFLPRLGVFQGGAMEDVLLRVTGLGKTEEDYKKERFVHLAKALVNGDPALIAQVLGYEVSDEGAMSSEAVESVEQAQKYAQENPEEIRQLAQIPLTELTAGATAATWQTLRQTLITTGLIQIEPIPGVDSNYLKFHPTLAPVLRSRLTTTEATELNQRYGQQYYQLSSSLYRQDDTDPHTARAIAKKELPNLLAAVNQALIQGNESAVDFVDNVNYLLNIFGLNKDRATLTQKAQELGKPGSKAWYLAQSGLGEQLFDVSRYQEAEQIFQEILAGLEKSPNRNRSNTLVRLGRCLSAQGRNSKALEIYQQAISEVNQLPDSDGIKKLKSNLQTQLGDVLVGLGDYQEANAAYKESLVITKGIGDIRGEAVTRGQLGNLALVQGKLAEAAKSHQEALQIFQQLQEPASQATAWHQLGIVYHRARQWEPAEKAYREAARIKESLGRLADAATTWNQLALVNEYAGNPAAAETWFRKAVAGFKAEGDKLQESRSLNNLANLLQQDPNRLTEAQKLAESTLVIVKTLDPSSVEIWKTYNILAKIIEKQGDSTQATAYRRLSQEAYAQFSGMPYQLQQYEELIAGVVSALEDATVRRALETYLEQFPESLANLVTAIRTILAGERKRDILTEPLNFGEAAIVNEILNRIQ